MTRCPDCSSDPKPVDRREFLKTTGATAAAVATTLALPAWATAKDTPSASEPESVVKLLYESLNDSQKKQICFDWNFTEGERGLLRSRVANNWQITDPELNGEFYTKDQRAMVRQIFEGIIQPDWHRRIDKQLEDDAGGFGQHQSIAIFGKPGEGQFEFVMTGRHMTLRCDGNSAEHLAFGGPLFYGHAAQGFNEKPDHAGNIFWPQAQAANKVFQMLDGKQRELALVQNLPDEASVGFQGTGKLPGIPVTEMSADQKAEMQKTLAALIEPYRQKDRDEALACLKSQGGLDRCSLAFYRDGDIGNDQVWDCWRLEGPAFVWYFRGSPHVHVWVNIADSPSVQTNTQAYVAQQ